MNQIKKNFLKNTSIRDVNGKLEGVEQVFDLLTKPENLYKMVLASEYQLPALTFVVKELEKKFDENSLFPVVKTPSYERANERQNVGRMVKFIMSNMGFIISYSGISGQARIPNWTNSSSFITCAVYKKDEQKTCKYKIECPSVTLTN